MTILQQIVRRHTLGFRITASLGLVVYGILVSGLPLPMPVVLGPTSGEGYPCENSTCGCAGAEQCWSQCCCNTLVQRLDWALREGVRPPVVALVAAKEKGYDTSHWENGDATGKSHVAFGSKKASSDSCCSAHQEQGQGYQVSHVGSPAPSTRPASRTSDCETERTCACSITNDGSTRSMKSSSKVVMLDALACQGGLHFWQMTMAVGILLESVPAPADLSPLGTIAESSHSADSILSSPDPPPPKAERI